MSFIRNTDKFIEGAVNQFFTDSRARSAVISQLITNGVTDRAPSEDVVFDALALKLATSLKGSANGLAELDADGKVPSAQLPSLSLIDVDVVANEAARLALVRQEGDIALQTDNSKSYIYDGAAWQELTKDAFAKAAAVVNSSAGSETDKAMSVSAAKTYTDNAVSPLANKALSNLENVAINTSLLFGADASSNIGAVGANRPNKEYLAYGLQIGGGSNDFLGANNDGSIWMVGDSGVATDPRIGGVRYSSSASAQHRVSFRRSRGSIASPEAVQSGDNVGRLTWSGMGDAGSFKDSAQIIAKAAEGFTNNSSPANMEFQLTPSGSTSLQNVMKLNSDKSAELYGALAVSGAATLSSTLAVSGAATLSSTLAVTGVTTLSDNLLFATDASKNIGAVGANRPNKEYLASGIQVGGSVDRLSSVIGLFAVSDSSASPRVELQYYRDDIQPARFSFRKARGSEAVPSAAQAADELGRVTFSSMGDAGSFRDAARIAAFASENASNTSAPGYLQLQVTPSGSVTPAAAMQINSDKSLELFGTQQKVPVNFELIRPADTGVDARGYGKISFENFADPSSNNQTQIKFDLRRNSTDSTARLPLVLQTDHAILGRGLSYRVIRKSASYTVPNSEPIQVAEAVNITYTLPLAPIQGQVHMFKDSTGSCNASNPITIQANSGLVGSTVDGAASYQLTAAYEAVNMIYDSSLNRWLII